MPEEKPPTRKLADVLSAEELAALREQYGERVEELFEVGDDFEATRARIRAIEALALRQTRRANQNDD